MPPDGLPNCPGLSRPDRKRNEVTSFLGTTRRGALFCRSGNWLEIIDERTSQLEARRGGIGDQVRGTRREGSRFSVLEFLSVAIGLVSIRGEVSQRYLCMDRDGKLYAAAPQNYTSECVFLEEMMENYYNLYSSCAHGTRKRPWYVALRRTGRSRRGKNARRRRKASHFLVVHYDTPPPRSSGQYDLGRLLAPSLKHQPPKDQSFVRQALAKQMQTRIERIQERVAASRRPTPTTLRKLRKRKRRRQQRLEREQRRRQQRQQELERLREEELSRKRRPKLSGAGLLWSRP